MNKPPTNDAILVIDNTEKLAVSIKERALNFYIITFKDYKEFIDVYDDRKLKLKMVLFWINQYTFISEDGKTVMYSSDYEVLVGRIYKEYCEIMMNKLVDIGHLKLMWDKKKKIVFWKKTKV